LEKAVRKEEDNIKLDLRKNRLRSCGQE